MNILITAVAKQSEDDLHHSAVSAYHTRKAFLDRLIASALLLVLAPLIILLIAIVASTSEGAAIYKQVRVGKKGRRFHIYKIRTMYKDAEALRGPQWAVCGDPRITPFGRALRFLHLDELPQLVNVVLGEMSLIGPRPERPEFVEQLALDIPNYCDRLAVLPGITGLAQINLPPDDGLASVQKKTIVDREYVATANAMLDLRILVCTALRMFGIRHGRAARWLGVEYRFPAATAAVKELAVRRASTLEETELDVDDAIDDGLPRNGRSYSDRFAFATAPHSDARSAGQDAQILPRRPR